MVYYLYFTKNNILKKMFIYYEVIVSEKLHVGYATEYNKCSHSTAVLYVKMHHQYIKKIYQQQIC